MRTRFGLWSATVNNDNEGTFIMTFPMRTRSLLLTFLMLYILVSIPIPRSFRIISFSANFCWLGFIDRAILMVFLLQIVTFSYDIVIFRL